MRQLPIDEIDLIIEDVLNKYRYDYRNDKVSLIEHARYQAALDALLLVRQAIRERAAIKK